VQAPLPIGGYLTGAYPTSLSHVVKFGNEQIAIKEWKIFYYYCSFPHTKIIEVFEV
jgi:hypothetical protein